MASHTITVQNQSGSLHNYIISQEPIVKSDESPNLWPCVLSHAKVPFEAVASFTVNRPNPFYAYAVTSNDPPGHGVQATTEAKKPIELGRQQADGTLVNGTSVEFVVRDGAPDLDARSLPPHGNSNSFEIRTGDFSSDDATDGNWAIGFGNSDKPFALFQPQPNVSYQLTPTNIIYLNFSDVTQGSMIDTTQTGETLKLDLSTLPRNIRVRHEMDGRFVLEKK